MKRPRSTPIEDLRAAMAQTIPTSVIVSAPHALQHVARFQIERDGLQGNDLKDARSWIRQIPSVAQFLNMSHVNRPAAERHLVLVAYSAVNAEIIQPTDNTVVIGIGDDVQRIEDVAAFRELFAATANAGMSAEESTLWLLAAHNIPQPHFLSALSRLIAKECLKPSLQNIQTAVFGRLKRKLGSAPDDAYGVSSKYSHAWGYVGEEVLNKQLRNYTVLCGLASELASMALGREKKRGPSGAASAWTVEDVCRAIAQRQLAGLGGFKNYWVMNLARLFMPEIAAIPQFHPDAIETDAASMELMRNMGEGAVASSLLGVRHGTAFQDAKQACAVVRAVTAAVGRELRCTPAQLIVQCCESHRRGALTERSTAIRRRNGL